MLKTIKYRLILFLNLATILVGIVSFGYTHYREVKIAENIGQETALETAKAFALKLKTLPEYVFYDIWWSYDLAAGFLRGNPYNDYYREIEKKIIKNLTLKKGFIQVINLKGQCVYSQGIKFDPAYFNYLLMKHALEGSISGFYELKDVNGQAHIAYLRAEQVVDEKGKTLGLITLGYSLQDNKKLFFELLGEEINEYKFPPGLELYWGEAPIWHYGTVSPKPLTSEVLTLILKHGKFSTIAKIGKKNYFITYLPAFNQQALGKNLILGVFVDREQIIKPYYVSFWQGLSVYVFLWIAFVLFGIFLIIKRQVEKPYNELINVIGSWLEGNNKQILNYFQKYPEFQKLFDWIYRLKTSMEKLANQWYRIAEGIYKLGEAANDNELIAEIVTKIKSQIAIKGLIIYLKDLASNNYFVLHSEGEFSGEKLVPFSLGLKEDELKKEGILYFPLKVGSEELGVILIKPETFKITEEDMEYLNNFTLMIGPLVKLYLLKSHLASISLKDPLTQAYNRRFLEEEIKNSNACNYSLIFIDLDKFKDINDTYGHGVGDQVLIELITEIKEKIRGQDKVIRMGGDEILIYLPNTRLEIVHDIAERLMDFIRNHDFRVRRGEQVFTLKLTASMGVGSCRNGESFEELLTRVDKALYRAKARGRNCFEIAGD